MVTAKKTEGPQIKEIPMRHVMAFNAVSAPAYMGQAMGHIWKSEDGKQREVIVIAKDIEGLQQFVKDYELEVSLNIDKTKPVGMCHAGQLRIIPASGYSGATGGSIPVAQPTGKQDEESEEW